MIRVRCVNVLEDALPLRAELDALNLASARPDPFSTFGFYENYLRNAERFGPRVRLWLLLAFEDTALVGYAALKQTRARVLGLPTAKLEWLTAQVADRPHLVARRGAEAEVAQAIYAWLLERRRHWSLIELEQQEDGSPLAPPPAARAGRLRAREWPGPANGTIVMRWASTREYFAALSHKARSNVGRQLRHLLAAGEVRLLHSADREAVGALFALYRRIEPHSWKGRAGAAIGRDARSLDYWTGLLGPRQPMRIHILVLLLDGAPVAGLICGAFHDGLHALHIVYDERVAHLGPGSAVLLMGVRLAIRGRYATFNLLRGSAYYKTRWLAQMSETRNVQVYRARGPFYWRRLLGDLVRRGSTPAADADFNPKRRDVVAPGPAPAQRPRGGHAGLVSRAMARGECLTGAQIAAESMPER